MDYTNELTRENAQKKYRLNQSKRGLIRFELQVSKKSKRRFDEMVEAVADEYNQPWDKRRRIALARAEVFDEITRGSIHEFTELKQQISSQKEEISALAPSFFYEKNMPVALPSAIQSLPDDPDHLKALLAKMYQEAQTAKLQAREQKRKADQFEKLYNVQYEENEKIQAQLKEEEI